MEKNSLKQKPKEEILDFIRKRLAFSEKIQSQLRHVNEDDFKKEHRRFNMSGEYDTVFNTAILNEFADLGIYDYTSYLFLNFHKGNPTLYIKYLNEGNNLEFDFSGYTTSEIIYEIFKLTIFSDDKQVKD